MNKRPRKQDYSIYSVISPFLFYKETMEKNDSNIYPSGKETIHYQCTYNMFHPMHGSCKYLICLWRFFLRLFNLITSLSATHWSKQYWRYGHQKSSSTYKTLIISNKLLYPTSNFVYKMNIS